MIKVLTAKVKAGLNQIDMEMGEYAAIKDSEGDKETAAAVYAALKWIDYQVMRCERKSKMARIEKELP